MRFWAHVPSYPSGQVAVTIAMVVGLAFLFLYPRLRGLFWAYAATMAVTRFLFGAHFPTDVIAGSLLGCTCLALVRRSLVDLGASFDSRPRDGPQGAAMASDGAGETALHLEPHR